MQKESLKTIVAHFCDDIYDNYRIVNAVLDDVVKDIEETADVDTFNSNDVEIAFTRVLIKKLNVENE